MNYDLSDEKEIRDGRMETNMNEKNIINKKWEMNRGRFRKKQYMK